MGQFRSITLISLVILGLLLGSISPVLGVIRTYLKNDSLNVDNNGLVVTTTMMGVGVTPSYGLDVAGTVRFRGAVGTQPPILGFTSVNWMLSPHQFVVIQELVPQAFTFGAPRMPCTLLLVVSRNVAITFPANVKWAGGAAMTFPAPTSGSQLDIFSFVFDGIDYIGFANLDFKVGPAGWPGGK